MRLNLKKIFCVFLAVYMGIWLLGVNSIADKSPKNILALGDSISMGFGLSSPETESFTALLEAENEFVVNNKAVMGNTASGILNQFNKNKITQEEIKTAHIVTITCGGNDLMTSLYERVAALWNNKHPDDIVKPSKVPAELMHGGGAKRLSLMKYTLEVLDKDKEGYLINTPEFAKAIDDYIQNLNAVAEYIHSINKDAVIIVATQYNPYVEFKNGYLAGIVKIDPICSGMEDGTTRLNQAIRSNAEKGGYFVADVKDCFDNYQYGGDFYNASPQMDSLNLDFHPTALGHSLIAKVFKKAINDSMKTIPKTSDKGNMLIYYWAIILSGFGIVGICCGRKVKMI